MQEEKVNEIIRRETYFCETYKDIGKSLYQKKDFDNALSNCQEAVKHFNLLSDFCEQNNVKSEDLLKYLQDGSNVVKKICAEILTGFGDDEFKLKHFDNAFEFYKNVLYYDITDADLLSRIATCLNEKGAYNAAIYYLQNAIELNPENASFYSFIAFLYGYKTKEYDKSIQFFKKYLELKPNDAHAYNSLGHINELAFGYKNTKEQIELFERALLLEPNFVGAIRNLAITYPRVGRFDEAINCYKKLFELENLADDYFSYACLQIKLENFEEGWKYFDYRFKKTLDRTGYPMFDKPEWKGEDIKGKTLLVQYEQGFGDTLQFFRYIKMVEKLAGKVILRVQNSMTDLLQMNTDVTVVSENTPIKDIEFDYHVPMMSLPVIFKTNKTNIPQSDTYLKADDNRINLFKEKVFNTDKKKVGISWHGALSGNPRRNIPLVCFKPILKREDCKFYSFQKGVSLKEVLSFSQDIYNLGEVFDNFSETAAAMANLDYFITSDNCLVHLAGALGIKTFLLLNEDCEWRWFQDTESTPFYDSVKIIKKKHEGQSWEILIQKVLSEIE